MFIKHTGIEMPVKPSARVIYRCIDAEGKISHVHHTIAAGDVNWSKTGQNLRDLGLGRVYDYRVVL